MSEVKARLSKMAILFGAAVIAALPAVAQQAARAEPLVIQDQGSFAVGGTMALTKLPIIVFYGDNIPAMPTDVPTQDAWRGRLEMARVWADAVNRHGGQVRLVHLPQAGIRGNTHFPFSDLNNIEIADQVSTFLAEKKLD